MTSSQLATKRRLQRQGFSFIKKMTSCLCAIALVVAFCPGLARQAKAADDTTSDSNETITIGTGTSSDNHTPIHAYDTNGISQTIYSSDEIGVDGSITAIAYNLASASSTYDLTSLKVYMGYKSSDSFSSTTDGMAESDLTLVYDGVPDYKVGTTTGWETITLDTPFDYARESGNLVIVCCTKATKYASSVKYYYTSVSNTCLYRGSDNDATAAELSGTQTYTRSSYRANVQLTIEVCDHAAATFVSTVAPTCTEGGYDIYHCPTCNKDIKKNETAALGHDWSTTSYRGDKDGTANENGKYNVYTCSRCDALKLESAADTVWDGETATIWSEGEGTEESPYIIATAANLAYLASQVNAASGAQDYSGVYFKQSADLDMADEAWTPIGNSSSNAFAGHYDGNNKKIAGLNVSVTDTYAGLFGNVSGSSDAQASITGVVVSGAITNAKSSASVYTGGVAGYANYATISQCSNTATINAAGRETGGIVGQLMAANVESCSNTGVVTSTYSSGGYTGGIAGTMVNNAETVKNCYNTADITSTYYVGGVVGYMYNYTAATTRSIENCYNAGTVTATSSSYSTRAGGILGYVYSSGTTYAPAGLLTNCYSLSGSAAGDIVGYYGSAGEGCITVTDCSAKTADEMTSADFVTTMGDAYIAGTTYPILSWEAPAGIPVITESAMDDANYAKDATTVTPLSITATGEEAYGTLVYQWYVATDADLSGASAIEDATTATYTPAVDTIGDFYYYCTVHNDVMKFDGSGYYTVASPVAHINVWSGVSAVAPTITTQPTGISEIQQLATEGNTLTVAASFAGEDETEANCALSYQWQVSDSADGEFEDVADEESATTASFAAPTTEVGTKYYRCVVTNTREAASTASTTSDVVSVAVKGKEIGTVEELKAFRDDVNNGNAYTGATVTLTADLDLAGEEWTPIGSYTSYNSYVPFEGEFDGAGHTISGLAVTGSIKCKGLFGYVKNGEVRNLVVDGTIENAGDTYGIYCAGVAAYVSDSAFENCGSNVAITKTGTNGYLSSSPNVGGIAGWADGATTFTNCYNKADITINAYYIGGIVGRGASNMVITSCYNLGAITNNASGAYYGYIGGLSGCYGKVSNSYNAGTLSTPNATLTYGGALVGRYATFTDASYYLEGCTTYSAAGSGATSGENVTSVTADTLAGDDFVTTMNGTGSAWLSGASIGQSGPMLAFEYVSGTPVIVTQPQGAEYEADDTVADLSIVASLPEEAVETGSLSYQWYKAETEAADPTADTELGTNATQAPGLAAGTSAYFYCVVTDTYNGKEISVTSDVVQVLVHSTTPAATPVFTTQPASEMSVAQRDVATLEAAAAFAEGEANGQGTITYQWYSCDDTQGTNPVAIEGATEATFTGADTSEPDVTLYYFCRATNTFEQTKTASADSTVAALTVTGLTVSTADGLKAIADNVNNGTNDYEGMTIKLTEDIDLSADEDTATWTPIGKYNSYSDIKSFKGVLDGQGHTISGLNASGAGYQGLFGYIDSGSNTSAGVKNLIVQGSVSSTAGPVAGVVAYVKGSSANHVIIQNVGNEAAVSCTAASATTSGYTGGVVGNANSGYVDITGCYNKGDVTTNCLYVGGILGYGTSTGTTITSCYNAGAVSTTSTSTSSYNYAYIGGIVGGAANIPVYNSINVGTVTSSITASYYDGAISGGIMNSVPSSAAEANYWLEGSHNWANGATSQEGTTSKQNAYNISVTAEQLALTENYDDASLLAALNAGDYADTWVDGATLVAAQATPGLAWEETVSKLVAALKDGSTLEISAGDESQWSVNDTEEGRSYLEATKDNTGATLSVTVPSAGWLLWDWKLGNFEKKTWPKATISVTTDTGDNLYPYSSLESNTDASGQWNSSPAIVKLSQAGTVTWTWTAQGENSACIDEIRFVPEGTAFAVSATSDENTVATVTSGETAVAAVPPGTKVTYTATSEAGYVFAGWKSDADATDVYSTMSTFEQTVYDEPVSYYAYSEKSFDGSGTAADPFLIKSMDDLSKLKSYVDNGNTFAGQFFKLANDIDAQNAEFGGIGIDGTSAKAFAGTFDGADKTISNIKLTNGLFNYLVSGAVLKNLTISGATLTPTSNNIGIAVAHTYGATIENVSTAGTITAGEKDYVGGVVGNMGSSEDSLSGCSSSVTITSEHGTTAQRMGGITGYARGSVANCTFTGSLTTTGNFVGGIAGSAEYTTTISGCVADCTITGGSSLGGIVGYVSAAVTVENCEFAGTISGTEYVGGIVGQKSSGQKCVIESCLASGSAAASEGEAGGIIGLDQYVSTVQNNIALVSSVSGAESEAGRIVGATKESQWNGAPTLAGNYAYEYALVNEAVIAADDEDAAADKKQGATLTLDELYATTTPEAYSALGDAWTVAAGAKPKLTANSASTAEYPDYIAEKKAEIDALKAQAEQVRSLIDALGKITLESGAAIESAEAAYEALSDDAKAYVPNYGALQTAREAYDKLVAAEEKALADATAAAGVEQAISELPSADELVLDNAESVAAVKAQYDSLTTDQQALVSEDALTTLNNAVAKIDALQAAKDQADEETALKVAKVESLISAISDPVTLADKKAINAAQSAFDALSADEQALVSNASVLSDAQAALTAAQDDADAAAQAQARIDNVRDLIDAIGKVDGSEECAARIAAAQAAYDTLSAEEQALVSNANALAVAIEAQQAKAAASSKTSLEKATVTVAGGSVYTGENLTPAVTVTLNGTTLVADTDYTLAYADNKNAGAGVAIVTGKGSYEGTAYSEFAIAKAKNTMVAKAKKKSKTVKVKASKLAKKNVKIKKSKAFKVTKAQGSVTFALAKVPKKLKGKITITAKGKIVLSKGVKKGTYKIKVKVKAAGNNNYKALSKKVTLKIKVK